eukprot:353504-Chlamydomonas_euryale.AAC.5
MPCASLRHPAHPAWSLVPGHMQPACPALPCAPMRHTACPAWSLVPGRMQPACSAQWTCLGSQVLEQDSGAVGQPVLGQRLVVVQHTAALLAGRRQQREALPARPPAWRQAMRAAAYAAARPQGELDMRRRRVQRGAGRAGIVLSHWVGKVDAKRLPLARPA